ncbi:MAG: Uma2 family endonuclease, partial [Verrucomicrobia bacterium]|nr:Uma2 family endonuclease [Cytophagales bacterium]
METTILHFSEEVRFTDDEFYEFCQQSSELKFERNVNGNLLIVPLSGGKQGKINSEVNLEIVIWNRKSKYGIVFDSSTAFRLPDTSVRSPDVAVVETSRWNNLSEMEKEKFVPLCPDFVIEVLSPSDRLKDAQQKM